MATARIGQSNLATVFTKEHQLDLHPVLASIKQKFHEEIWGVFNEWPRVYDPIEKIAESIADPSDAIEFEKAVRRAHELFRAGWNECREALAGVTQSYHGKLAKIASTHPEFNADDPVLWASECMGKLLEFQIPAGHFQDGQVRLPLVDRWFRHACDGSIDLDLVQAGCESGYLEPWCAPAFAGRALGRRPRNLVRMTAERTETLLEDERFILDDRLKWVVLDSEHQVRIELAMAGVDPPQAPAAIEAATANEHALPPVDQKLPQKFRNLASYLDAARLTERQRDCFSLRMEYQLPVSRVAKRLGISRKTVDEHLAAAAKKINEARANDKRSKDRAKFGGAY